MSGNGYALQFGYDSICLFIKIFWCLFHVAKVQQKMHIRKEIRTKLAYSKKTQYFCPVKSPIFDEISFC